MEEDPVEELERTFIFDPIGFGYINMSHGMLVEISEELRAKFPKEPRLLFSQLNNLHLASRSGEILRFVEILNSVGGRAMQSHLVNTVSIRWTRHFVNGMPFCVIVLIYYCVINENRRRMYTYYLVYM